jgi:GNAT superfamily N-acetyltransferase
MTDRDLPAVVALYEEVGRSGDHAPGLEDYFRRLAASPWADPDIPSLVWDDPDAGVVASLSSHVRELRLDGHSRRLACSGQLAAAASFRGRGVGALLLRAYLRGPQDVTITDGATEEVMRIWTALGGDVMPAASIGWTTVFSPATYLSAIAKRRHRATAAVRATAPIADAVDLLAARRLRPHRPDGSTELLTPELFAAELPSLGATFRLLPDYDARGAAWLFGELEAVTARGRLTRALVRDDRGQILGWYIAYLKPDGISSVIHVAASPRSASAVLDHLLWDAVSAGSAGVHGRVEPHLLAALRGRCLLRPAEWVLVHGSREVLAAMAYRGSLVTRLEGEWWMGHHLTPIPSRPTTPA